MDLSTGGDLTQMRRQVLQLSHAPVGTVPIYQAAVEVTGEGRGIIDITADDVFRVIEQQAAEGVDFMTVHCGVTQEAVRRLRAEGRITDVVSRGGSFLTCWMLANEKENPLYEQYDRLLEICQKHDVTLSLGDGLRPGCLGRRHRPGPDHRADHPGRADRPGLGRGRAGDDRGAGPRAPGPGAGQHPAPEAPVPQRAFLCVGSVGHRRGRRARPRGLRHRRGPGRLGRGGLPVLRDPQRTPGLARAE